MGFAVNLLKADHIGIRELKGHLSKKFLAAPLIITDRGEPVSVSFPYSDAVELADILDEIADPGTLALIQQGRQAIHQGVRGIPVKKLFERLRAS